jgi:RNAse (barnase) inhibitor barstar
MRLGYVSVVIDRDQHEEVTEMHDTMELSAENVAELRALWDRMREEAISDSDRHEIDEIFARQMP